MAKVSLRAYNREIEAMIDRNHLDEAVAHCQHILKTFPKHLETYRLLGKAYLEAKRHKEAGDIFSRVLAAEPNDFVSHVGMSIIRDEQNKIDDAIWHMERAYEVQSANPAIQGELQRLYGRRDGVQPPRIRMTRGALAHMYMRGELYPQAISETRGILAEDQGRSDMQVLLAKAYYRSGQKKDAADAASAVLKRYPFCLDANLVLAEILGTDRPESAQTYRHRVVELDPYAGQAVENMFRANEVSDAAISLEHLDWNGQPVGMSEDWGSTQAIGLESGIRDREAQPEWMKASFAEEPPLSATGFDSAQESSVTPAQPADDIPDFLRAAGWGASTGAFDESRTSSMFEEEPASSAEPIAKGDLPDWVKAMAPQEASQPADEQEEEMPDWINKIGTGELPVPSTSFTEDQSDWLMREDASTSAGGEETDWMKGFGQEEEQAAPQPSDEQPDWMKGFGQEAQPTPSDEQPDWMKGFGQEEEQAAPELSDEQPDWMKGFGQEAQPTPSDEQPDWLKSLGEEEQPAAQSSGEQPDWMKGLGEEEAQPATASSDQPDWLKDIETESGSVSVSTSDFDFLDELTKEPEGSTPLQPPASKIDTGSLGTSEQEQDDSFAWLENLAAKQGATEGLLTKPEERIEDEPDWIKQAKSLSQPESGQPGWEAPKTEPTLQPSANVEDLGKSGQEIDDALAWFESLAAKQGATEGLLTKPEERKDQEPEWVKKVKGAGNAQRPVPQQPQPPDQKEPPPSTPQPAVSAGEPGKSEQEIDDALAWFEGLAAKQGATEGLLTKPEDRLDQEPEWVKQAKTTGTQQPSAQQPPAGQPSIEEVIPEPEASLSTPPEPPVQQMPVEEEVVLEPEEEKPAPGTETIFWLKGLAAEEEKREASLAEERDHDTMAWLKSLDEPEPEPVVSDVAADDLPAWMQEVSGEEVLAPEPNVPTDETEVVYETPVPAQESASEELPSWLSSLEEEKQAQSMSTGDDLPAWLRDETGEVLAEPTKIEPTRTSDWAPVDETKVEAIEPPPSAPQPATEPMVEAQPEPSVITAREKPAPKAKKSAPKKEEVKPTVQPEPYKEPVTRRGAGMLTMPEDPILGSARTELSRSNIPGALETYGKLIKKGRFLEEVIYDLREALYRYPVEVSIWQTLGDAYMRANQLQDALDAYTKAEELLR